MEVNILRNLDGYSLLQAYQVSKLWKAVIKGDPILRNMLKQHLRKMKLHNSQVNKIGGVQVDVKRESKRNIFGYNLTKSVKITYLTTVATPSISKLRKTTKTTATFVGSKGSLRI